MTFIRKIHQIKKNYAYLCDISPETFFGFYRISEYCRVETIRENILILLKNFESHNILRKLRYYEKIFNFDRLIEKNLKTISKSHEFRVKITFYRFG